MGRDRLGRANELRKAASGMNMKRFALAVAILILSVQAATAAETPAFWLKGGDTVVSVSYTHLDVYKRQRLSRIVH